MMKRLMIGGNGFDLAHGLPTRYWDFRNYLEENYLEYLLTFEKMYNFSPADFGDPYIGKDADHKWKKKLSKLLWEKFEETMGLPDIVEMLNASECILESLDLDGGNIGIEDTMDEYWRQEYGFVSQFQEYVKEWIEQISIDGVMPLKKSLVDDNDCYYFSFNYTETLEKIYQIEDVLHIHGSVGENTWNDPIMGHFNYADIEEHRKAARNADEELNEGEASIQNAIVKYLESIFKDTNKLIENNARFFERISDVNAVTIIGWSAGHVDIPYLKKLSESVCKVSVWHVYWYDAEAKAMLEQALEQVGIDRKYWDFHPTKEYWDS